MSNLEPAVFAIFRKGVLAFLFDRGNNNGDNAVVPEVLEGIKEVGLCLNEQ